MRALLFRWHETLVAWRGCAFGGKPNRSNILLAASVLFGLLLVGRHPAGVFDANFWAEDGWVWYPDAYRLGPWSLILPHSGYLQSFPRLVALAAQSVPLLWAPTLFAVVALVIQLLPPVFLLSRRFDAAWPNPVGRFLFCLVYIALPNSFEEFGNVTNSQWYLSILAFLILASTPPRTAIGRAADILTLIVSGLTGPFCIFLFPIAVCLWRRAPGLDGLIRLGCAGFCASVQGAFLLATMAHDRAPTDLGVGFGNLARIIAMQVVLGVAGGSHVMSRINEAASWRDGVAPVAIASLAGAIFVAALLRGTALFRMFAVFGALVFTAALASPVGIQGGPAWPILAHPGAEQRYYLIPMLVFAGAIFTLATDRHRSVRRFGFIGCCALVIGITGDWPYPRMAPTNFSVMARQFAVAPTNTRLEFELHPPGVAPMVLTKR